MLTVFLVFIVSVVGTFLSVISGGGASLITIPMFLSFGMPAQLAISVNKLSGVFSMPISAYIYLKGKKINWVFLLVFSLVGLVGSYFGAVFVIKTDQGILEKIMGVIILFFAVYTYFKKDLGIKEKKVHSHLLKLVSYPVALLMGFYESIMGTGLGIAFSILTFYTRGFALIEALGYYYAIAFFWVAFAAGFYVYHGYYDLWYMVSAILGSMIGSYFGSRYAKLKGNKFIKTVFVAIGVVLGLKLLLF
ncbi:MAG: sulfite exporter TauE/SafE family protein [Candidatus Gracilibacteria bacterium]|jgi:hypothetical protein